MFPQEYRRREPGVGKRADMAYWGEWSDDGSVKPAKEPSTATLTLAYQLTGEVGYALRALQSAATRLTMARRVLRGGREHADMGGAVCSVAAGHGRNWGQGAVTACYGPLILGTREILGKVSPLITVRKADGSHHLPSNLLSLVRPIVDSEEKVEVTFYNSGDSPIKFSWQAHLQLGVACETIEDSQWFEEVLEASEIRQRLI